MPLKFANTDEARKVVLDESKKWRTALEKARTSKEGAKELATTMVAATDTLVSAQAFTLDVLTGVQIEQGAIKEGLDHANKAMDMLSTEHNTIREAVNQQEKEQESTSKEAEKAVVKAKATQNALHRLQLERSQTVVIVRNLAPLRPAKSRMMIWRNWWPECSKNCM